MDKRGRIQGKWEERQGGGWSPGTEGLAARGGRLGEKEATDLEKPCREPRGQQL